MKQKFTFLLALLCTVWIGARADGHDSQQTGDVASVAISETTTYYADLHEALTAGSASGSTVTLLSDVSLSGAWTPITSFAGTFDGAGKTISNLTINGAGSLGLFASTGTTATVKNLTIDGASVTGAGTYVAVLAAQSSGSLIDHVNVTNSTVTSTSGQYAGGMFGSGWPKTQYCTVSNCKITGVDQVGGFIGYLWVGGLNNCKASNNTVTATQERAGGLMGKMQVSSGNVGNSTMTNENDTVSGGIVTAPDYAGGFAGQFMSNIDYAYTVKNNIIEGVILNAPEISPIATLRKKDDGTVNTDQILGIDTKISGNTWNLVMPTNMETSASYGAYGASDNAYVDASGNKTTQQIPVWVIKTTQVDVTGDETAEATVSTDQTSHVEDATTNPVTDTTVKDAISTNTTVTGVQLTTTSEDTQTVSGLQAVVNEVKTPTKSTTTTTSDFQTALASATDVNIKVDVKVTPSNYVAGDATTKAGTITYDLKPYATVTVGSGSDAKTASCEVTNDMIDQNQNILVNFYTGFQPAQVLHIDDDGSLIESFTGDAIAYNSTTGVSTVTIHHFSDLVATQQTYVAQIGDTYYYTLEDALTDANATSGATIKLIDDYSYSTNGEGLWNITSSMTIDGNGHTLSGWGKRGSNYTTIAINFNGSSSVDVTLKDLTISNGGYNGRPIETRGNISSFTLDGCTINATYSGNNQGLTVGGNQSTSAEIKILNSKISVGKSGYPYISFNPANVTIENSYFSGFCAMYLRGIDGSAGSRGTTVKAKNSNFDAPNASTGGYNSFAVFECEDDGISVALENCTINAEATGSVTQSVFSISTWTKPDRRTEACSMTISGADTKVNANVLVRNSDSYTSWYDDDADYYSNITYQYDDDGVYWYSCSDVTPLTCTVSAGIYSTEPAASYIASGKAVIANTDADTKATYPYKVIDKQTMTTNSDYTIDGIENTASTITDDQKNAVASAMGTDEDPNSNVANYATDISSNVTSGAIPSNASKNYVSVKLQSAVTSKTEFVPTGQSSVSTVVKKMTFDVKPVYIVITTDAEGNTTETETVIPNSDIQKGITFRLPVDKNVTASRAIVYHYTSSLGYYNILGDAENGKYIEVTSKEFSEFSYLLTSNDVEGTIYTANNTTGTSGNLSDLETTRATYPNAIMIVDEDYAELVQDKENVVVKYSAGKSGSYYECPKFVLTDDGKVTSSQTADFYTPVNFTAVAGSYTRSLTANSNSCCLPFAIEATSDVKVQTFAYYENTSDEMQYVYFNEPTEIAAGVPCLLYCSSATDFSKTFDNTEIVADPINSSNLKGTFAATTDFSGSGYYSLKTGGLTFGDAADTTYPFRAALSLNHDTAFNDGANHPQTESAKARILYIGIIDDEGNATSIDGTPIANPLSKANDVIYTINGVKVTDTKKPGLYIINGKKTFVK